MASALAWALRSQSQSASALSRPPLFQRETGKGYSAADSTAAYAPLVVVSDVVADQSEDATAEEAATVAAATATEWGICPSLLPRSFKWYDFSTGQSAPFG